MKNVPFVDNFDILLDPITGELYISSTNPSDFFTVDIKHPSHHGHHRNHHHGTELDPVLVVRRSGPNAQNYEFSLSEVTSITIELAQSDPAKHSHLGHSHHTSNNVKVSKYVTVPIKVQASSDNTKANDIFKGGSGDDFLTGGGGSDRLYGNNGNDTLIAGEGKDKLYGGNGNDDLIGGNGHDYLRGDRGNDRVWGDDGNDRLYGKDGNDTLSGGKGKDKLYGGNGDDKLDGGIGDDHLRGDKGNDRLRGHGGNDKLDGGDGDDHLRGDAGRDKLNGGKGDDFLNGGRGNDYLSGSRGFDIAEFTGSIFDYKFYGHRPHRSTKKLMTWGEDGFDKLYHIEKLEFDDYSFYINGQNNAPYTRSDWFSTDEDTFLHISTLMDNDMDIDRDTFVIKSVEASGSGSRVKLNSDGTVIYDPTGTYDYLAIGEQAADSFIYTVIDDHGGERTDTANITVIGLNDLPEFGTADTVGQITEGNTTNNLNDFGQMAFSDVDVSDTHTVNNAFVSSTLGTPSSLGVFTTSITAPTSGGIGGQVTWNFNVNDANIQFLAQNQNVVETYNVTIDDGNGGIDTIETTVTLHGTNDAPIGNLDTNAVVGEGFAVTVDVLANDTDVDTGAVLTLVSVNVVSGGGTASIVGNKLVFNTDDAYESLGAGQAGEAVVEYVVRDEFGAQASSAAFIKVNGLADAASVKALQAFAPTMTADYATEWHFQRLAEQGFASGWNNQSSQSVTGYSAEFQTSTGSQSMFGLGVGGVNFDTTGGVSLDPAAKGFSFAPGFDFGLVAASVNVSASADAKLDLDFSPQAGFSAGAVSGFLGVNTGITGTSSSGDFLHLGTSSATTGGLSQNLPTAMSFGFGGAIDAAFSAAMSFGVSIVGPDACALVPDADPCPIPNYSSSGTIFNESVAAAGSYNLLNGTVNLNSNTGTLNLVPDLNIAALTKINSGPLALDLGNVSFGGLATTTTGTVTDGVQMKTVKNLLDIGLSLDDVLAFIPQLKALQALDANDIPVGPALGSYILADLVYNTGFDLEVDSNLTSKFSVDLLFDRPVEIEGLTQPVIALRNADWNNLPGIKSLGLGPVKVTPVFNTQTDYQSEIELLLSGNLISKFGALSAKINVEIGEIKINETASFGPILNSNIAIFNEDIADIADPSFSLLSIDQFQGDTFSLFG